MASDVPAPPEDKNGGAILALLAMQGGGLINSAELAIKVGEVLCEAHYRQDELARQKPLRAVDRGHYWRVEGSWNRDGKIAGTGNFYLSIEKRDGRVTDFGMWARNPEGEAFLKELMAAQTPEEKAELIKSRLATARDDEKKQT